jgi:hypothetical protein
MTRRRLVIVSLGGAGLLGLLCCGGGALLIHLVQLLTGINNSGSPELAQEWRAVLEPFADPEDAARKDSRVQGKRFADGDWVFGLCQNSHGLLQPGGGTLVVKDSRGAVRAFFGHVCGQQALEGLLYGPKSLDEFYTYLLNNRFQEYEWPKESRQE